MQANQAIHKIGGEMAVPFALLEDARRGRVRREGGRAGGGAPPPWASWVRGRGLLRAASAGRPAGGWSWSRRRGLEGKEEEKGSGWRLCARRASSAWLLCTCAPGLGLRFCLNGLG